MTKTMLIALLLVMPAQASPGSRDVRLLSADQIASCTRLGSVTETRASGKRPDDAAQKALSAAMDKAAKTGANVGVIADGASPPGRQTIVLQTYRCGDGAGFTPAS